MHNCDDCDLQAKPTFIHENHQHNQNGTETTFIWHIKNFEICPDLCNKPLKSPEFEFYKWQNPKFYLLLYPGGVNEDYSKYLSAYLVKTSFDEEKCLYSIKLGIVTSKEENTCYEFQNKKIERGKGVGRADFFQKGKLLSDEKENLLPDGQLTIFCRINKFSKSLVFDLDVSLRTLSYIYGSIYKKKKYCDISLHAGDGTFKCHRVILEARFPDLLKHMYGNECKVKDINSKTMNALLHYIYTGYLNINEIDVFEILTSEYDLPSHLKSLLLERQKKIEFTTCFQKSTILFSWDINRFNSLNSGKSVHYPLVGDSKIKWTWLNLIFSAAEHDDYISIAIQRFSKDCKKISCKIKTSKTSKTFYHTFDKEDKWILPNFFTKSMLKSIISDQTLNKYNMDFAISVTDGSKVNGFTEKELIPNSNLTDQIVSDLISFNNDLINISNEPKYCDTTLISGKKKFPAHKFILSARSSVFRQLFESQSDRKKTSEIVIDELDSSVIKDMIAYMYCNNLEFSQYEIKHFCNLYAAATKYNLTGMKDECANFLKSNISADVAGDILISADEGNDDELKETVYEFVVTHPQQIASSKEWEQVMQKRSDLASEVSRKTLSYYATKNKISTETD